MSKLPKRTAHFDLIERKIIATDGIRHAIKEYKDVMFLVYRDISTTIAGDKQTISKILSNEAQTLSDRIQKCDYIEALAQDYSRTHRINVVIVRLAIKHIFDLLQNYSKCIDGFVIDDFLHCIKEHLMREIDVAISIKSDNGTNTSYRINLGRIKGCEKNIDSCVWYWQTIQVDRDIDADSIRSINTFRGQDVSRPSQHRETSRLIVDDDGTMKIEIKMKKELPIANPNGGIIAIDVGLNRFLTMFHYDVLTNRGKIIKFENRNLLTAYKSAVDKADADEINNAIFAIQQSVFTRLNKIIDDLKPKYVVLENIREGLEKTESDWTNNFPWIDHQTQLANEFAAKGVYVIWVNPRGTSSCHAYSTDTIVRDSSNHSIGFCCTTGDEVDCDNNAVINIISRGVIKILVKFVLEDKAREIKRYAEDKGYQINALNYAGASDIIKYCKQMYNISLTDL